MAFDSEIQAAELFTGLRRQRASDMTESAPDPDPQWADSDPARLVAYLFVSPRPCAALDALLQRA